MGVTHDHRILRAEVQSHDTHPGGDFAAVSAGRKQTQLFSRWTRRLRSSLYYGRDLDRSDGREGNASQGGGSSRWGANWKLVES